jgi:sugar phosphate isomerase/epimerase
MKTDVYLSDKETKFSTGTSDQSLEQIVACTAEQGFDGIELMTGNLMPANADRILGIARSHDLEIVSLASGFIYTQHGMSFTHPNAKIRAGAVRKTKESIEFAHRLGASFVSIGLVRGQRNSKLSSSIAREYLAKSIHECGEFASKRDIVLIVEPENRYENGFLHTVDDTLRLLDEVHLGNVKLLVDTFHMNIEEASIGEAIRKAGEQLVHVHLADSNRLAPSLGHLDFGEVMSALQSIGYDGYLGLEIQYEPSFESAIKTGMRCLKQLMTQSVT